MSTVGHLFAQCAHDTPPLLGQRMHACFVPVLIPVTLLVRRVTQGRY